MPVARRFDYPYNVSMILTLDRFGFPFVRLTAGGSVALLPLLKVQFEWVYGNVNGPATIDYDACLTLNRRGGWHTAAIGPLDPLVLTGLLPDEATAIAAAFGDRRLPTPEEWRETDAALDVPMPRLDRDKLLTLRGLHPAAALIVQRPKMTRWRDLGAGYLEWVRTADGFGLYGDPRPDFDLNWLNNRRQPTPMIPRKLDRHRSHTVRFFRFATAEGYRS